MGIAWGLSFNLFKNLIKDEVNCLKFANIFFIGVFITSWIGAKVFFLITTQQTQTEHFITNSSFWLGGGFVFYGGLVFGIAYSVVFILLTKQNLLRLNPVIPPLLFGHAIGRLGCFLAGCCFGKKWLSGPLELYPVQLLESFGLMVLGFISLKIVKTGRSSIIFYIVTYSLLRFCLEFLRGDKIRGIWYVGFSTSQIVALVFIGISTLGLIWLFFRRRVINKA